MQSVSCGFQLEVASHERSLPKRNSAWFGESNCVCVVGVGEQGDLSFSGELCLLLASLGQEQGGRLTYCPMGGVVVAYLCLSAPPLPPSHFG